MARLDTKPKASTSQSGDWFLDLWRGYSPAFSRNKLNDGWTTSRHSLKANVTTKHT